MKVKICGLTSLDDSLAAVDAGADLLGFNFYPPSPRYIDRETCALISETLHARGYRGVLVGVFVNAGVGQIDDTLNACGLDLAQLSGDEPPGVLAALGQRAFKALRPANAAALAENLALYPARQAEPAWLVDAYRPGEYGGTGAAADWNLARQLAGRAPILLAGGLRPENVAQAARAVRPWGVDVASGVESAPGHKDLEKIKAFIRAVRAVEAEQETS
jgi:phosphoribosylanthranilate isomerase